MVPQPDGKIIIGGFFSTLGGNGAHHRFGRVYANGSLDPNFNCDVDNLVNCVAVQEDGKILLGGSFTSVNGTGRTKIARVYSDGSLDTAFNPGSPAGDVNSLRILSNGQILVASQGDLRKLNAADGTAAAGFATVTAAGLQCMALQSDGQIVLAGGFATVNAIPRAGVARVSSAGVLDGSFTVTADKTVRVVTVLTDGSIVLGGDFGAVNSVARTFLAKVDSTGALQSFNPVLDTYFLNLVNTMALQADGRFFVAGFFSSVNTFGRSNIARLYPNGTLDYLVTICNATVYSTALDAGGAALLAGNFDTIDSNSIPAARLYVEGGSQSLSAPGLSQVQWMRSGTAPEVEYVKFELSTDGGTNWTPLGNGSRISGGWQLSGLSLPAYGYLRARGRTLGGNHAGSSGLVEQVAVYPPPTVPTVATAAATDVTYGSAMLHGSATANRAASDIAFEFTTDSTFVSGIATTSPTTSLLYDALNVSVSASLSGLLPETTYYFRTVGGNSAGFSTDSSILSFTTGKLPYPVVSKLFARGDTVPSTTLAIFGNFPPADAKFASFGVPAINDSGAVAFAAKWKGSTGSAAGVFAGNPAVFITSTMCYALDANGLPFGPMFKSFRDPVLASDGSIAFIAKFGGAGVTTANDEALFTNADGKLRMVARKGSTLPGAPAGSQLKSFSSASISSDGVNTDILFTGSLLAGAGGAAGAGGVTTANDVCAWRWNGEVETILREGGAISNVSASGLKTSRLLMTSAGSAGQSRGHVSAGSAAFQAAFQNGSQALVSLYGSEYGAIYATGAATVPSVPGATWSKFGAPAVSAVHDSAVQDGRGLAFLSYLTAKVGGVLSSNAERLFFNPVDSGSYMIKITDPAADISGATFSSFQDPLLSPDGNRWAFLGGVKNGGVTSANNLGIWSQPAGGSLTLDARKGGQPPDVASGAQYSSFSSVAVSNKGPIYVAKLLTGVRGAPGPGGIVSATDTGLWAKTSFNIVRKMIQKGDVIDGKTVKTFTALTSPSGSTGIRRSFAADGDAVVLILFTDASQAIYSISCP